MDTKITLTSTGIQVENPNAFIFDAFDSLYNSGIFWELVIFFVVALTIFLIKGRIRRKIRERKERRKAQIWKKEMEK